jgi:hypothetical protein
MHRQCKMNGQRAKRVHALADGKTITSPVISQRQLGWTGHKYTEIWVKL